MMVQSWMSIAQFAAWDSHLIAVRWRLRFDQLMSSWTWWLAVSSFAIIAIAMVARWWLRRRETMVPHSPRALLAELCRAHGLAWRDCRLLWALADCHGLESPTTLFLSPERFRDDGLDERLSARTADLRRLERKLFAGLAEDPPLDHREGAEAQRE